MLTFTGQIQRATDTAKFTIQRLTGAEPPRFDDAEQSISALTQRIDATLAFLASVDEEAFAASPNKISIKFGPLQKTFEQSDYILMFALPNFFFHVATAHDILRHIGVKVGKLDYLGLRTDASAWRAGPNSDRGPGYAILARPLVTQTDSDATSPRATAAARFTGRRPFAQAATLVSITLCRALSISLPSLASRSFPTPSISAWPRLPNRDDGRSYSTTA